MTDINEDEPLSSFHGYEDREYAGEVDDELALLDTPTNSEVGRYDTSLQDEADDILVFPPQVDNILASSPEDENKDDAVSADFSAYFGDEGENIRFGEVDPANIPSSPAFWKLRCKHTSNSVRVA